MSSTREIKQRIANIDSVSQLIHAMHMVASTQLTRASKQLHGAIPVQEALKRKIDELSSVEGIENYPYFDNRPVKNTLYLVFTGDRGLAGSYNNKVQKFALEQMNDKNEDVIVVGSFGHKFFKRQGKNVSQSIVDLADSKIYYGSEEIADALLQSYLQGKSDEVYLIYTEFENVLNSKPTIEKLLPIPVTESKANYEIFGPDLETYLDDLIPFYLHMSVFRAFSEAHTSEQASRMVAMDTAGTNASDLVEELQRNLNRQRQQEITQELSEIVGQNQ